MEIRAIVKGKVQGVGFRASARKLALKVGLVGSVENLPDGSVEIFVQGPLKQIDLFFETLPSGVWPGAIEEILRSEVIPMNQYSRFQIF